MQNKTKCILCNSIETEIKLLGNIKVTVCMQCEFQYIENSKNYLEDGHFDNYFDKRKNDNAENKNFLRKKQYLIDSKVVENYIYDGANILDVGCSSGEFLSIICSLKECLTCHGIDIDESGIKEANKKFSSLAYYQKKDLLTLDVNKKYDLIIFRGTFQYLDNSLHKSMQKLKSILNKNGKILIFSLPSTDSFMYYLLGEKWGLFHPEMSLMFNGKSLHKIAEMHGFGIDELTYPYLEDVYANKEENYENTKNIILGSSNTSSAFWGSLMTVLLSHDA